MRPVVRSWRNRSIILCFSTSQAGDRSDITAARKNADAARDAYAAAQADTLQATDRRKICSQELESAESEQSHAEAAQVIAEHGTNDDLAQAKQVVAESKMLVASVHSRGTLRDRQVDHALTVEDLRLKENQFAQANVEVAKARAVKRLDRPEAKSVDVAAFELQARQYDEQVQVAKVRAEAAQGEVKVARLAYDTSAKVVPTRYTSSWPNEKDEDLD